MNRRFFCKIAGFAALFSAAPKMARAAVTAAAGRRCVITVLRRECFSDLQAAYLDEPEIGACSRVAPGQRFNAVSGGSCPEGMCPKAWRSIQPEVERLLGGDCECGVCGGSERSAVVCCGDGTRPVIFRVEIV